jgi:hypothetical protein
MPPAGGHLAVEGRLENALAAARTGEQAPQVATRPAGTVLSTAMGRIIPGSLPTRSRGPHAPGRTGLDMREVRSRDECLNRT